MLFYSLISILILKRQLNSAQCIENNIFEVKNLKTPFVFGLVRPKIYLPVTLYQEERSYILLHEHTHIHRKDNIIKILAFLILSIHWFNPLAWIAFMLMSTDMELSCDESVLRKMNQDMKKPYANSLLSLATGRHVLNGCPIAFGEGNVKGRVKNVLNYRKPTFWIMILAVLAVVVVSIGLLANPKDQDPFNKSEKLTAYEFSNLRYGQVQYRMSPLSHDNAKLAEAAIRDYMMKSAAWPGIDIKRIETSYLIHTTTYDGKTSDYFAFMHEGKSVLQQGENGQYSIIDNGLYEKLTQLISGKLTSASGVDESKNISLIWNYNPYYGHLFPALPIEFDLPYNKVNVTVNSGSLFIYDYSSNMDIHYDKELTLNINQKLLWYPFEYDDVDCSEIAKEAEIKFDIIMKDGNTKSALMKVKQIRDSQVEDGKVRNYTVGLVDNKLDFDLSYTNNVVEHEFLIKLH